MNQTSTISPVRIAALYRFVAVASPATLCAPLKDFCEARGIKGTLLLAGEGINGTVAGTGDAIDALVGYLSSHLGVDGLEIKYSHAGAMPFHRMKVRLKREIVTMGIEGIDPAGSAGVYVEPGDWNDLIGDPDTIVIDTRNRYETQLGTFAGALDPATDSFRDFPEWLSENRERLAGRKVAMFCTGGIRCEKATAYARSIGIEEVFHLKGGILKYLEEVPQAGSLWQGECFVFDERVSVRHGLVEGEATLCRACRHPLTEQDRASPHHDEGIACIHCHADRSEVDRARYAERQRQVEIAAKSGKTHIGS